MVGFWIAIPMAVITCGIRRVGNGEAVCICRLRAEGGSPERHYARYWANYTISSKHAALPRACMYRFADGNLFEAWSEQILAVSSARANDALAFSWLIRATSR